MEENDAGVSLPTESTMPPREVLLHLDAHETHAALIASTEGEARYIAGAPVPAHAPQRGIPMALQLLAELTGEHVDGYQPGDLTGVVIASAPMDVLVVGECDATDTATLSAIEDLGIIRRIDAPKPPSRSARRVNEWARAILRDWRAAPRDALLVAVPPGMFPMWASHLLSAVRALDAALRPAIIILSSGPELAAAFGVYGPHVPRGGDLAQELTDALASLHRAALPSIPDGVPLAFQKHALVTTVIAAQRTTGAVVCYLDETDGTLVIVAGPQRVRVLYDATIDSAAGAANLVRRFGHDAIGRWLPNHADEATLRRWAIQRSFWPTAVLKDPTDRAYAGALARIAFRSLVAEARDDIEQAVLCILGPSFLRRGSAAEGMRAVADILPMHRTVHVVLDADGLAPLVGLLSRVRPARAVPLYERDLFESVGTIVPLLALESGGDGIERVALRDGNMDMEHLIDVRRAALHALPLHTTGTLTLTGKSATRELRDVAGGSGGVLIDTRARPLTAAATEPITSVRSRIPTAAPGIDRDA